MPSSSDGEGGPETKRTPLPQPTTLGHELPIHSGGTWSDPGRDGQTPAQVEHRAGAESEIRSLLIKMLGEVAEWLKAAPC